MKLEGRVVGILVNTSTGEEKLAFDEYNHLQDELLKGWCDNLGGGVTGDKIYAIEVEDFTPITQHRDWLSVPDNALLGIPTEVASPSYEWFNETDSSHIKKLSKKFAAPASVNRIVSTIIIGSVYVKTYGTYQVDAAITLSVPCVQTPDDILFVFYKVQLPYLSNYWETNWPVDSNITNPTELKNWGERLLESSSAPVQLTYNGANWSDKINPRRLKRHLGVHHNIVISGNYKPTTPEYFKVGIEWNIPLDSAVGTFIGISYFYYNQASLTHPQRITQNTVASPLQNVIGHSSLATFPFYDAGTTETGLGEITMNGDAWTNPDFPLMLFLDITATGILGVSSYKFRTRRAFGFVSNTYENRVNEVIGYGYYNSHLTDNFKIIRGHPEEVTSSDEIEKVTPLLKYDEKTILAGWVDEIMISDVPSQEGTRFAADTLPRLDATNITQFCKDEATGDIYVACRNLGVFKIAADLLSITRYYFATPGLTGVTGCYGINVTTAGRLWAYFNGTTPGLYYSDNNGTSWTNATFSHGVIDSDPTLVTQIIVDPSHIDDQICVIYADPTIVSTTRNIYVAWWDLAGTVAIGGVAVQGPTIHQIPDYEGVFGLLQHYGSSIWTDFTIPLTIMNIVTCSPNNNFWICKNRRTSIYTTVSNVTKLFFGTPSYTETPSTDLRVKGNGNGGWGVDENFEDAFFFLTNTNENDNTGFGGTAGVQVMLRNNLTFEYHAYAGTSSYFIFSANTLLYLGKGVHLCAYFPIWTVTPESMANNTTGGIGIISALPITLATSSAGVADMYNELYTSYGWTGVAWEIDNVNSKPTHATVEEFLDGVTVSFDDALGAFQATDFYTSFLFNGIVLDGSTTCGQELDLYFKPAEASTDLELSTLPATTRIPGELIKYIPQPADWQDTANVTVSSPGRINSNIAGTYDLWGSTGRSNVPVILGNISNLSSTTRLPSNDEVGIQGYLDCTFYYSGTYRYTDIQEAFGLSNIYHIGQPLTGDTMMYGVTISSENPADGSGLLTLRIIESGVVKETITGWNLYSNYWDEAFIRIIIKTNGSIIYEARTPNEGMKTLYVSPVGTATIEDLYFEYAASKISQGLYAISSYKHVATADHYLFLGNGVDTGLFNSSFRCIDPTTLEITIDGTLATNIGISDTDTVLAAGEYSIFPFSGVIRYSPSDVGKTISGNFTYVRDVI